MDLILFPFNGNTMEALEAAEGKFKKICFVDDDPSLTGTSYEGFPIEHREAFEQYKEASVLALPGNAQNFRNREKLIESLNVASSRFAQIFHPTAAVSSRAKVGHNVFISAQSVVSPNARIGNHVNALAQTVVHHDSTVGDYTMMGSQVCIAGYCTIGSKCYLGSGTNIRERTKVADGVLIGMGSNVLKDVAADSTVFGNPAKG